MTSVPQHLHAALLSKQRSIKPFVGGWAEPSQFPSPANCPWIGFGFLKRHDRACKTFLCRPDTKWDSAEMKDLLLSVYTLTLTHRVLFHVRRIFLKFSLRVQDVVDWWWWWQWKKLNMYLLLLLLLLCYYMMTRNCYYVITISHSLKELKQ